VLSSDAPHQSDGQLLGATRHGDGAAYSSFYRRYLPAVIGFLLRETRDRGLTTDLAAEVFAAALASARRFRPRGDGSAWPWLHGISVNKLRESCRRGRVEDRARRKLALDPEALDDSDLARVDELASGHGLMAMVDELPHSQRQAIRARIVEERDYAEIASELRCSEMVIRQRVSRGLSRLKEQLKEQEG
jgi:RNA polymerase sigma factor (sigma-70 family)